MSANDLKGRRILIVGLSPQVMTAASMAGLSSAVLAAKVAQEMEDESNARNPWPTQKPTGDTSAEINFVLRCIEPMPDVKIDKTKDRFSFADHFVGRGKRRNR